MIFKGVSQVTPSGAKSDGVVEKFLPPINPNAVSEYHEKMHQLRKRENLLRVQERIMKNKETGKRSCIIVCELLSFSFEYDSINIYFQQVCKNGKWWVILELTRRNV